ncbi:MAG: F0F1 ATP synthase subunit delta [Weeksellaceae bacterium]
MKIDPELKQDLRKYLKSRMDAEQQAQVTIVAPHKLSKEDVKSLQQKFPMLAKAEITQEIDTALIAGVVIRFGSRMIDLSLQSQLQKLEKTLYETV